MKLRLKGEDVYTVAEGDGPVNALDAALRKALIPVYPNIEAVTLDDYKVRIIGTQPRYRRSHQGVDRFNRSSRQLVHGWCFRQHHRGQLAGSRRQLRVQTALPLKIPCPNEDPFRCNKWILRSGTGIYTNSDSSNRRSGSNGTRLSCALHQPTGRLNVAGEADGSAGIPGKVGIT